MPSRDFNSELSKGLAISNGSQAPSGTFTSQEEKTEVKSKKQKVKKALFLLYPILIFNSFLSQNLSLVSCLLSLLRTPLPAHALLSRYTFILRCNLHCKSFFA